MFEMPARTGRRIQDAAVRMRESLERKTEQRQKVSNLHRQRMTCSGSLRSFSNTQDWTGGMGISPSGRFQVVESTNVRRKLFSRDGIRWDTAWIALAAVAVLCVCVLLADFAGMGLGGRVIGRLDMKIEDQTRRNETLRQEVELNAGDVSVCTEAIKLDMVSAYGAPMIILTAPQTAAAGEVTADARGASGWTTTGSGQ